MHGQGQLRLIGGRKLLSPRGSGTRPTTSRVREAIMNILSPHLMGSSWLDLCSGSGVMGCEALQRGARRVVAVEKESHSAQISKLNLTTVQKNCPNEPEISVVRNDAVSFLKRGWNSNPFDLVYFDPPYRAGLHHNVLSLLSDLQGQWLTADSLVVCEYAARDELVTPGGWITVDRRRYGMTGLLILSPPERPPHDGTDSKRRQTSRAVSQESDRERCRRAEVRSSRHTGKQD